MLSIRIIVIVLIVVIIVAVLNGFLLLDLLLLVHSAQSSQIILKQSLINTIKLCYLYLYSMLPNSFNQVNLFIKALWWR